MIYVVINHVSLSTWYGNDISMVHTQIKCVYLVLLTMYLPSLKRDWSVRMTASSVSGPCRWIKSSMSLGSILLGLLTVLLGEMMRACGLAPVSGGPRRNVPPFDVMSAVNERIVINAVKWVERDIKTCSEFSSLSNFRIFQFLAFFFHVKLGRTPFKAQKTNFHSTIRKFKAWEKIEQKNAENLGCW